MMMDEVGRRWEGVWRSQGQRINSVLEILDLGRDDFHRARATTSLLRNRLRMPAAGHNRERFLPRDQLVSVPRGRILPRKRAETSS